MSRRLSPAERRHRASVDKGERRRKTPTTTLSRAAWRLVFAYEEELQKVLRGRRGVMAYRLRALGAYFKWLIALDVDLPHVCPEDLHAFRLTLSGSARDCARRFEEIRRLYRFLYCRGLLRHDPGAVELPRCQHSRR